MDLVVVEVVGLAASLIVPLKNIVSDTDPFEFTILNVTDVLFSLADSIDVICPDTFIVILEPCVGAGVIVAVPIEGVTELLVYTILGT